MVTQYPCVICDKSVHYNSESIQCDNCEFWVHRHCNNITHSQYIDLVNEGHTENWFCLKCIQSSLPFSDCNNNELFCNLNGVPTETNLDNMTFTMTQKDKRLSKHISKLIIENTDPDNPNSNFCKYYDINKFTNSDFSSDKSFSILHLNIASLSLHLEELIVLLKLTNYSFDIIAISETKIQNNLNHQSDISIPNYNFIQSPTFTTKGGTLLYVSDKLIFKRRTDLELSQPKDVESTFAEITTSKGKNIIVGCIYKHHTINQLEFEKMFLPILEKLNKENKPTLIAGDYNIDLLKINNDSQTNDYFDTITNNNFMPLITLPTRITARSKTLIDNILYNQFNPDIRSGNLTVSISDHTPQFVIIPSTNKYVKNKHNSYKRDFKNLNYPQLNNEFAQIDWSFTTPKFPNSIPPESHVDDDLELFFEKANRIIDKLAPLKKMSNKDYKLRNKPWINRHIIHLTRLRDSTHKKLNNTKNQAKKIILEFKIKNLKNKIKHLIRDSKKAHLTKYFAENNANSKKLWKGINELILSKNKKTNALTCLENTVNNNTTIITDPKEINNVANNYFTNVAEEILKKRKYNGNTHFTNYLKTLNPNTFLANPSSPEEVEDIIKLLDSTKSVGPNSIPTTILKEINKSISPPISNIFNKSIKNGTFPNALKLSQTNPIHKKDSTLIISNYRPISLLSNINKIFEKLMFKRLYKFLEKYNCIYKLQFGFRQNHSTNHAMLGITEKIQEAINNDQIAYGIFIDLQKAFDTVNHEILLHKLQYYGVRGNINQWFQSYLTNRKQFVNLNGYKSDVLTTMHGVPQGSVLGPLLFLLYINDLHVCIKNSTTFHFADDTNLLYIPPKRTRSRNIVRKLNVDLKAINHWLLANKIALNSSKTELITFKSKNKITPKLNIKINGVKLIPKPEIKYLGLIFDTHLTFKTHINIVNSKLKRANNLLSISRHYLPPNLLKQLYFSQFHSHLSYGCQIWGSKLNHTSQTFLLQKKAIRLISFADFNAHTDPIFKELEIVKFFDVVTTYNTTFVHNTLNGKSPIHFAEYFTKVVPAHNYNTNRNVNSTYRIPSGSLVKPINVKNTLKNVCITDWNKIIKELTNPSQLHIEWLIEQTFCKVKKLIKKHFLSSY